jgi:hypothetical protein
LFFIIMSSAQEGQHVKPSPHNHSSCYAGSAAQADPLAEKPSLDADVSNAYPTSYDKSNVSSETNVPGVDKSSAPDMEGPVTPGDLEERVYAKLSKFRAFMLCAGMVLTYFLSVRSFSIRGMGEVDTCCCRPPPLRL